MNKIIYAFLTFSLWVDLTCAQTLPIPQHTYLVGVLNSESFNKKVNFEKLLSSQVFEDIDTQIKGQLPNFESFKDLFFNNSKENGVSFLPNSIFWTLADKANEATIYGYVLRVSDSAKLEQKLITSFDIKEPLVHTGYKSFVSDKGVLAWNSKIALFISSQLNKSLDSEKSIYISEDEENKDDQQLKSSIEKIEQQTKRNNAIAQNMQSIAFDLMASKNLLNNDDFNRFLTKRYDIGLWVSNAEFSALGLEQNPIAKMMMSAPGMGVLNEFTQGTYQHILTNFDDGLFRVKIEQTFQQTKTVSELYSPRTLLQNLAFINGSKLFGIGNMSLDIAPLLRDAYRQNYELIKSSLGPSQSQEQTQVNEIILDEKRVFGLLGKDVTISVVDFVSSKKTYTEYEYNDKDEMVEVKKTKVVQKPIVTAVIGLGNRADMQKVMDYFVSQKVFEKDKKTGFYSIPNNSTSQDISASEFKIALLPSQMVISNQPALVKSKFKAPRQTLPAPLVQKMTQRNSATLFLDMQKIIDVVKSADMSAKQQEQADLVKSIVSNISFESWFDGQQAIFESSFDINLNDKSKNSFEQIINLINELYLRN